MIKFYEPEKGFSGILTYCLANNKKDVIMVDIKIDPYDINKFMKILSTQGKLKNNETISLASMELSNDKIEDISTNKIFQGDFTCGLDDGKDNIFKGYIRLGAISFNLDASKMEKIDDNYTSILYAKMIIHPGECSLIKN